MFYESYYIKLCYMTTLRDMWAKVKWISATYEVGRRQC